MSERYAYILLSNEKWWNRLCTQKRAGKTFHAFVRKGTVGPKQTELILFYVTYPFKEIRGFGEFVERVTGSAGNLWKDYGHETCLKSFGEYLGFLEGRTKVSFIRLTNLHVLDAPISASVISRVTGINRMPRSGRYISKEMTQKLI
jgi:predicted transcriptional regulator